MKIRKGMKFRLEPTLAQRADMVKFAGHNRAVWNKALAMTKDRLERKVPILWYHELNWNMTRFWKKSEAMSWLNEAPSQTLQQTLKHFDRAIRDCFDKTQPNKRLPRFKKKGQGDSFVFPQGFKVEGNRIKLPKLGWVKFRKSRALEGQLKSVTVSRQGKHWLHLSCVKLKCQSQFMLRPVLWALIGALASWLRAAMVKTMPMPNIQEARTTPYQSTTKL